MHICSGNVHIRIKELQNCSSHAASRRHDQECWLNEDSSRASGKYSDDSRSMNTDDLIKLVTLEMPFGKHQGRLIADLPANYLHWFAREGFPPGEIGRLLELMREIDHNGLKPLLAPIRQSHRRADKPSD